MRVYSYRKTKIRFYKTHNHFDLCFRYKKLCSFMLCNSFYKIDPVNRVRIHYIKIKTFVGAAELGSKLTEQRRKRKKF